MALKNHSLLTPRWALALGCLAVCIPSSHGQVFVVGEKSATSDVDTSFTPTNLLLPPGELSERGRRELVRNLEAEQGFAHRALPMGSGITLRANGPLSPGPAEYRHAIFEKGLSAAPGDRIVITAMVIKSDRIVFDLNGGPFAKHRFLSHIQINDNPIAQTSAEQPTGARVTLVFEGRIPEISAPEIKALLEPVLDFGVKTSEQAYADTLPPMINAVAAHEVLVGMNHRMVLAALGAPESKIREQHESDPNAPRYEEWIYGHVPQTVRFIRFQGDRVTLVKIAALGKPLEIHDKDEMNGNDIPMPTREIALGDRKPGAPGEDETASHSTAPTLRKPGEPEAPNGQGKVQYPTDSSKSSAAPIPPPPSGNDPSTSSGYPSNSAGYPSSTPGYPSNPGDPSNSNGYPSNFPSNTPGGSQRNPTGGPYPSSTGRPHLL